MSTPLEWEKLLAELEVQALATRTSESAKTLKSKVQEAMTLAESNSAPPGIIDRMDLLMLVLTESSRENVCTNTNSDKRGQRCTTLGKLAGNESASPYSGPDNVTRTAPGVAERDSHCFVGQGRPAALQPRPVARDAGQH